MGEQGQEERGGSSPSLNNQTEIVSEARRRWRRTAIVLRAIRQFQDVCQPDELVKQDMHKLAVRSKFRKSGHALIAMHRFKLLAEAARVSRQEKKCGLSPTLDELVELNEKASMKELMNYGGVHGLAKLLKVNVEHGLTGEDSDFDWRRTAYGSNRYPEKAPKSFWAFLWQACQDTTLIILMGCAVISLAAGLVQHPADGWYEGVGIASAVLIVIVVASVSDYRQSIQFRYLSAENANIQVQVLRAQRHQIVSIYDLLVGDVVPLRIGDQVPADGVLLSAYSLSIDESSMTGESIPRAKDLSQDPFLLSGCKVVDGFGSLLVTAVGMSTEWGRVMSTVNSESLEETPLQARLAKVATLVAKIGLTVASFLCVVLFVRYFVKYEGKSAGALLSDIVDILAITVTIIVVAVPEGLPLAVTLTLAYSMKKMMGDKALVRKLVACETMGSATCICSDKTGTLTLNQMRVTQTWLAGRTREADSTHKEDLPACVWKLLVEGLALNTTGSVFTPTDEQEEFQQQPQVTASPTEAALLRWGLQLGMDFPSIQSSWRLDQVDTFNSVKKKAGVLVTPVNIEQVPTDLFQPEPLGKHPPAHVHALVHWKGAAEIILDSCSHWMDAQGKAVLMNDHMRNTLQKEIAHMASQSLRCIALAHRQLNVPLPLAKEVTHPPDLTQIPPEIPTDQLTLTALLGLKDPCRPGVEQAVRRCQLAGVRVRMVTGDNLLTARAIAMECGILRHDGVAIEGPQWRAMSEEERINVLPSLDVLARSSPSDKLSLVQALRSMGEVVAVTGDGTNDAPALHEADIGLAMGLCGTEVAKESADIIIQDDNFATIVKVVRWGRSVYLSVQKFIQFQLTVNVVALTLNFIAACSGDQVPLTAVQLLWVNLIMDSLGALALATDPPTDDLLEKPPVGRISPLITNIMWRNLILMAVFQLIIFLTLNYRGLDILRLGSGEEAEKTNRTIIFNSFVFSQLFNEINARKPEKMNAFEGIHRNPIFIGVITISALFQVVIVEFLNKFASTTSLSWDHWLFCVILGSFALPWGALVKLIPVPEMPVGDFFPRTFLPKFKKKPQPVEETAVRLNERSDRGKEFVSEDKHDEMSL